MREYFRKKHCEPYIIWDSFIEKIILILKNICFVAIEFCDQIFGGWEKQILQNSMCDV